MPDIKFILVVIPGLFALLGGFLGAWLTRRTEYQKWLRQQRSIEFSKIIKQLEDHRIKALNIIYDSQLDDKAKDIELTMLSLELAPQENIIRLYLDKSDRDTFSKLLHDLWSSNHPIIEQTVRMKKESEIMHGIQSLFERTIKG